MTKNNDLAYWRRAHRDWRFWTGIVLMVVAMLAFVASSDLAWWPRTSSPPPRQVP